MIKNSMMINKTRKSSYLITNNKNRMNTNMVKNINNHMGKKIKGKKKEKKKGKKNRKRKGRRKWKITMKNTGIKRVKKAMVMKWIKKKNIMKNTTSIQMIMF